MTGILTGKDQTGWFVESLSTQVLVIFIIRTRGNPFKSRAPPILVATSLAVVAIAAYCPLRRWAGIFVLSRRLLIVEMAKRGFYHWYRGRGVKVL